MAKTSAQLDRDIAEALARSAKGSALFGVEIDNDEFAARTELPSDAHWRKDLVFLAEKELASGRTYRRPKRSSYVVIEWTGMRGAVGRLLDWMESTPGITRYTEIFT
jgi:hypothetical protein